MTSSAGDATPASALGGASEDRAAAVQHSSPPLECAWLGEVPYETAWQMQREIAAARREGRIGDVLLLLEHPPVYTMGRNGEAAHVPSGAAALRAAGAEWHDVDRGGSVTFHGPGQLVAYPLLMLAEAFPIPAHPGHGDVIHYLRALEEALIATCAQLQVAAERRAPYTGAWCADNKIAAIGVKLAGGVTTHGVALNVATDLSWFARVVPCGILDGGVTSVALQGGTVLPVADVAALFARDAARALGRVCVGPSPSLRAVVQRHLGEQRSPVFLPAMTRTRVRV